MKLCRANKRVLKSCRIYQMLLKNARKKHVSFHMPGHKISKWDITELAYSDNLSAPHGCIAQAEKDIAQILGAHKSFILTDGSTSGVLSMLYAAKALGVSNIVLFENSHKSVFNGCKLTGITPLVYTQKKSKETAKMPTMSELKMDFADVLDAADALFITTPDYYGNVADLKEFRKYCDETGKLLLVDGAHGGHLHFEREIYAGEYADMWVDGVHKSLPSLTQGAVVSARNERFAEALFEGVLIFRTTSPSYPIMASIEYAVKYPRNESLENKARAYISSCERVYKSKDWTKLCAVFGEYAFEAEKELIQKGIYPEFCDGHVVMFYLSPCAKERDFERLKKELALLFAKYPYSAFKELEQAPAFLVLDEKAKTEWVKLEEAEEKICASDCGLFPPCLPLIKRGEKIGAEKIELLKKAANTYGLVDGKILIVCPKNRADEKKGE